MLFAALSLASVIAVGATPAQPAPIACAFDQFDNGDRLVMGQALAVDLAAASQASSADKLLVQRKIISKMATCPAIETMAERQMTLAEQYTESRLLHDYADRTLGSTKLGGSMIDAVLETVSDTDRESLSGAFSTSPSVSSDAAAAFNRAMSRFEENHHLSAQEASLLAVGVTAQLGMTATEKA